MGLNRFCCKAKNKIGVFLLTFLTELFHADPKNYFISKSKKFWNSVIDVVSLNIMHCVLFPEISNKRV